jgi:TonB-linked SusC/RagA family outer membrane protein
MKKLYLIFALLLSAVGFVTAQRTVTGMVTDAKGEALIGANVLAKGSNIGTVTDVTGKYTLKLAPNASMLVFSYVGYDSQEIPLGVSNIIDVKMVEGNVLNDVVVTAMGVKRDKNELPYSAQKVRGEDVSRGRDANVLNSLSGRVAGLNVKRTNSMGGSTNVVLRGTKSLTGDNQALFVVDGVPIDNTNNNTEGQKSGRKGYDYGSAASDINPDDIAEITVLKGAAATALYGSRASNGAIIITTKKGGNKGLGVTLNIGANVGKVDKTTFASYQKKYGQGYGAYYDDASGFFFESDVNGDGKPDLVSPLTEDASWGAPFDANKLVYQWDAFDPTSLNYKKATPWVAAANDPTSFLQDAFSTNNGINIDGSNDKGYFKLGFNHVTDAGILPNSSIKKDLVNFGAGYNVTPSIKLSSSINFTNLNAKGRYGTGYDSKNLMTNFRQWWNVGVDIADQKAAYERNKKNVTWNWGDLSASGPIYWDNPYWTRNENYQNDGRGRYFGNIAAEFKLLSWLNLRGQMSLDKYSEFQEERIAVGSVDVSEYARYDRSFDEKNYDLMLSTTQLNITNKFKFNALVGSNVRKTESYSISDKTNGGLAIPGIYALANSANARNAPSESVSRLQVNGIYAQGVFNYDDFLFLDLSTRRDKASSLPVNNNTYLYPSASLGFIFSKFIPENNFLSFGKVRLNYAQVGNAAPTRIVNDSYLLGVNPTVGDATVYATSFNGTALASLSSTKNNANLKPERTKSNEIGLETRFFNNRVGLDVTVYKTNTVDQIVRAPVSRATGYSSKYINAGEIQNNGVELQIFAIPVKTKDFEWRTDLNWARNRNLVVSLGGEIDNLELAGLQGGITINATVGQPYGTIRGTNYKFAANGQKTVGSNGAYLSSSVSNEIIGNVNPNWIGGMTNSFKYKNFNLSFLIDAKKGGQIFSLDMYYGLATGLYPETAGLNDKGNEVRSPVVSGGGILLPGVKADGTTPNDKYYNATNFGIYGYRRNPAAGFIYDASFVKLRELNLSYDLPKSWLGEKSKIKGVSIGVYGRNLWILYKKTPYSDPEEGFSSGNVQGYQGGAYPTTKVFGANLNVKF